MPPLLQLQNYRGKGTESGEKKKKEVYASFFGWPEDCDFVGGGGRGGGGECVLGHSIAWTTSYCLLPDTFWLWASKNAFKVVKFANSLSPPSIVKKVRTGSKAAKRRKRCPAKVKGVNNPAWTRAASCSEIKVCGLLVLVCPWLHWSSSGLPVLRACHRNLWECYFLWLQSVFGSLWLKHGKHVCSANLTLSIFCAIQGQELRPF